MRSDALRDDSPHHAASLAAHPSSRLPRLERSHEPEVDTTTSPRPKWTPHSQEVSEKRLAPIPQAGGRKEDRYSRLPLFRTKPREHRRQKERWQRKERQPEDPDLHPLASPLGRLTESRGASLSVTRRSSPPSLLLRSEEVPADFSGGDRFVRRGSSSGPQKMAKGRKRQGASFRNLGAGEQIAEHLLEVG